MQAPKSNFYRSAAAPKPAIMLIAVAFAIVLIRNSGFAQTIANPGFESGLSAWTVTGSFFPWTNVNRSHRGSQYAYFGVASDGITPVANASGSIHQTIYIPPAAQSAKLSFWLWVVSDEVATTSYDYLYVEVLNNSGALLETLAAFSNRDQSGGFTSIAKAYAQTNFSLGAYSGQTIRIRFRGTTDLDTPTLFRLDDVNVNAVTVVAPNGSESWTTGTTNTITWSVQGNTENINYQLVALSADGESIYNNISSALTPDARSFAWTIPDGTSSSQARIRVRALDIDTYILSQDASDGNFSISPKAPTVTLTAPNGGEDWTAGTTHSITWTVSGSTASVAYYKIALSTDGGATWPAAGAANDLTPNGIQDRDARSFDWTIGNTLTTSQARIRVRALASDSTILAWDSGDGNFTITSAATIPAISTQPASDITATSAELWGRIESNGGSPILERRFEWAKASGNWNTGTQGVDWGVIQDSSISGSTDFSASLSGLTPNTGCKYRVWARNSVDWADVNTVNVETFTTYLPAPMLAAPPNNSSSESVTPRFIWSDVTDATSYRIVVATSASDLPTDPNADSGGPSAIINATPATASYTTSIPLDAGATYYWTVHARTPSQPGMWSSASSFTVASPQIRIEPLTLNLSGSAAALSQPQASLSPEAEFSALPSSQVLTDQKLIEPLTILQAFATGTTVKVVVRVTPPLKRLASTDFGSPSSLATLRTDISHLQDDVLAALPANDLNVRFRFNTIPAFSAEVTAQGLAALQAHSQVVAIGPVQLLQAGLNQGIPLIRGMTYRSTYNGNGVAIAICDTGVDYTHPMLGGGSFPNSKVIGGTNVADGVSDPMPSGDAHGTACAGIAAGNVGSVGDYTGGVAYNSKIYALKITQGTSHFAFDDSIAKAWEWCVENRTHDPNHPILVISTSFGGGRYSRPCDNDSPMSPIPAVAANAVAAGITILASSMNDGYCDSIAQPACFSSVISVGAVYDSAFGSAGPWCVSSQSCVSTVANGNCPLGYAPSGTHTSAADRVTPYSNIAEFLDLLAPSDNAYTLDIVGDGGYSAGDYAPQFGGTSAACPYAAGAVACLQQAAKERTGSYLTPQEVKSRLVATGDRITDTKVAITKPRVNLERVIESLPASGQTFRIYNDGTGTLTVNSITTESAAPWIGFAPSGPFDISQGSYRDVTVGVNFALAPSGQSTVRLLVVSSDAARSPYPGGVNAVVTRIVPLTVKGITTVDRTYDGTASASLSLAGAALNGVLPADAGNVALVTSGAAGAFADKNVGTGKTVTISGLTLSGSAAANYSLTQSTTTANITPLDLAVNGLTAANKPYDGTTAVTITGVATLSGVISGDTVSLTGTPGGIFANSSAGQNKPVVVSGLSLSGTDARNYTLDGFTLTADITPTPLVVMAHSTSRAYGTPNPQFTGAITGLVGGDPITLGYACGATLTSPVGTYDIVPSPFDLSGKLGNYSVTTKNGILTVTIPETRIESVSLAGQSVLLSVSTALGASYLLEFKNSLTDAAWSPGQAQPGTGSQIVFTNIIVSEPVKFFRIRVE